MEFDEEEYEKGIKKTYLTKRVALRGKYFVNEVKRYQNPAVHYLIVYKNLL